MTTRVTEPRGLESVAHYLVERAVIHQTLIWLQEAGTRGFEGFVLWTGRFDPDPAVFRFRSAVRPRQDAYQTEDGLLVTIPGEALHEVNVLAYEQGEILGGQAHSHPTDAYHSETDDRFPSVTILGGLSLVVPDFAAGGWGALDRWAWYRLQGYGHWAELPRGISIEVI